MNIMQGDSYKIPIAINVDGKPVNPEQLADVEIYIGGIIKSISTGDVTYSAENKAYLFPITQEEAFKLTSMPQKAQVRVKFLSGDVIGASLGEIDVNASFSKVVL